MFYTCKICGKDEETKRSIIEHIKTNHNLDEIVHIRIMSQNNSDPIDWGEIEEKIQHNQELSKIATDQNEMSSRTDSESGFLVHVCEKCRNEFMLKDDLMNHIKETHETNVHIMTTTNNNGVELVGKWWF